MGTGNQLRNKARRAGRMGLHFKDDGGVRQEESLNVKGSFLRSLAAGHFAIRHSVWQVVALHRHVVFWGFRFVVMRRDGALAGSAASHLPGDPGRLRERALQEHDCRQAEDCGPFARTNCVAFRHLKENRFRPSRGIGYDNQAEAATALTARGSGPRWQRCATGQFYRWECALAGQRSGRRRTTGLRDGSCG
jgi:hypothetical protein